MCGSLTLCCLEGAEGEVGRAEGEVGRAACCVVHMKVPPSRSDRPGSGPCLPHWECDRGLGSSVSFLKVEGDPNRVVVKIIERRDNDGKGNNDSLPSLPCIRHCLKDHMY